MQSTKVSLIMPVYNEEKSIKKIIKAVCAVNFGKRAVELIVVNDGSKDGTKKVLDSLNEKNIKIIHKPNGGKGSAVQEGIKHATGDIVVIQDADLEYDPNDIPKLLEPIEDKESKVVYGSRFLGNISYMSQATRLANKLLTAMNNIFYNIRITDSCTCYKVLDRKLIQSLDLKDNGFDICHEITSKLSKRKIKIVELPIDYHARPMNEKKAKWWNLWKSIQAVVIYRFSPKTAHYETATQK